MRNHPERQLLAAAKDTPLAAPIRFALYTGVRQGELLGLSWDDIDFTAATVTIRRSARYFTGQGMKMTPGKTARARRTVELSPPALALLKRHRQEQRVRRLRLGGSWQMNQLVFPSSVGTVWLPHNFYREYRKIVGRTGLTDPKSVVFHTLRHTAATQWLKAGAELHTVSRRLGHRSASFTSDTYLHLLAGMQRTAARAMDHLLA